MPNTHYVETSAPLSRLRADTARRTITGRVVPWGEYATVSTGQRVAFARGSLRLSERAKLILDHDPARPVAVYASATDEPDGLDAVFRVPPGPRGDEVLAEAGEGLRDGFSVGADIETADEADDGSLWVTAARGRHVALLSDPAFDSARVTAVTARTFTPTPTVTGPLASGAPNTTPPSPSIGGPMPATPTVTASAPPEPEPDPTPAPAPGPATPEPDPAVHLTAAGAAPVRAGLPAPARVRDPYPYARPHILGGPSFVRDAWASMENPGSEAADRWRRALNMHDDPAYLRDALTRFEAAGARPAVEAATGTTANQEIDQPHYRPDRFVPFQTAKAPLWSALTKYPTPDFNPILVPRTTDESNLANVPADEVTPVAPGNIITDVDTVTVNEIEGSYLFSRKLLMGSNPAIDRIALDAMDRAWLAHVEAEAVTYFLGANVHTPVSATYATADEYLAALLGTFADLATSPYEATDAVPARKEYVVLATAVDTTGRPLLPYGPRINAPGESDAGFAALVAQGVPIWPGRSMTANKTVILDQNASSAVGWVTPVMNFRLEWTTDAATGGNVRVLKLVKYSGVGYWSQHVAGVLVMTNTTPLPLDLPNGNGEPARAAGATKAAK